MFKTTTQIKQIVALGVTVSIDAKSKTTSQLKEIVQVAIKSGSTIIIRNAETITNENLRQIAELLPHKITFEL